MAHRGVGADGSDEPKWWEHDSVDRPATAADAAAFPAGRGTQVTLLDVSEAAFAALVGDAAAVDRLCTHLSTVYHAFLRPPADDDVPPPPAALPAAGPGGDDAGSAKSKSKSKGKGKAAAPAGGGTLASHAAAVSPHPRLGGGGAGSSLAHLPPPRMRILVGDVDVSTGNDIFSRLEASAAAAPPFNMRLRVAVSPAPGSPAAPPPPAFLHLTARFHPYDGGAETRPAEYSSDLYPAGHALLSRCGRVLQKDFAFEKLRLPFLSGEWAGDAALTRAQQAAAAEATAVMRKRVSLVADAGAGFVPGAWHAATHTVP